MLDTVRPGQVGCSSDQTCTVANVLYLPTHTVPYNNEVGIDILTYNFSTLTTRSQKLTIDNSLQYIEFV